MTNSFEAAGEEKGSQSAQHQDQRGKMALANCAQHEAARGNEREPRPPNTRTKEEKWSWLIVHKAARGNEREPRAPNTSTKEEKA